MGGENTNEVKVNPPTWFRILEELLNLTDAYRYGGKVNLPVRVVNNF
jgi:hypothetical protein